MNRNMVNLYKCCVSFLFVASMVGCAALKPEDVFSGFSQQAADDLIAKQAGKVRPAKVLIKSLYEEEETKTSNTTVFTCTQTHQLESQKLYVLTKHEGNYVEFTVSTAKDCSRTLTQDKFAGRYGENWLFLKRPSDATSWTKPLRGVGSKSANS